MGCGGNNREKSPPFLRGYNFVLAGKGGEPGEDAHPH